MDEEIVQLRELKELLLKKAFELRDKLSEQEENGRRELISFTSTLHSDNESSRLLESPLSDKYEAKLCRISSQVTGITFRDVSKKWLHDDVYLYTAKVITKMVSCDLELTVLLEDSDNFKIDDMICHLDDIDNCFMLEISPWFQKIVTTKNFSFLMSALSDYNEYSVLRSQILRNLESRKNATVEQYTEGDGGVLVYLHSSADVERNYVIFEWKLKFLDLTWHIEHFFVVKSTETEIEFSKENHALLKKFCQTGLTKNGLVKLWEMLCIAIDNYHENTTAASSN